MKRFLFTTVASTTLSCMTLTGANAAEPASSLSDKFYEAMIEKCLALGTLTPQQVDGLADEELKAVLRTCDTSRAAAASIAPAVPIAVAPAYRPRAQSIAVQPDPEFEAPASGGGRRFGGVASVDGGDGNSGGGIPPINIGNGGNGGGGGIGGGGGGGQGNGTANSGGTGGGTGGTGGTAGGTGGGATPANPPAPKLTNIQDDAVIGSKLKPGEAVASEKSKDLGNGLKQTTSTLVTKDAQGNVIVTQKTTVRDAAGKTVGTPKTTKQSFTPADVAVLKNADPAAGKGIPHIGQNPSTLANAKSKALTTFNLQNTGKLGNGQTAGVTCLKAPCPGSIKTATKLGDARTNALEHFKQMQATKHQPGKVADIKKHVVPAAKVATLSSSSKKIGVVAVNKQRQVQHTTVAKPAAVKRANQIAHATVSKRRHS